MANDFESLGAHLRNLMTPYATVIQLIDDLHKADEKGDTECVLVGLFVLVLLTGRY